MDKPWLYEGNALDFVDKNTGYQIALRRHPELLHWCGYVGIPAEHPWHGKTYNDVEELSNYGISVHGGLTYSEGDMPTANSMADKATWWFGFDCAHGGDLVPKLETYSSEFKLALGVVDVYRDIKYVKNEAINLAEQLAAVAPNKKPSFLDINRMFG